jgi:oligopeptide/dipeptide ABC transporter ATP-binding protein
VTGEPLLSVRDLDAVIDTPQGEVSVVEGVSFDVWPEEAVGLVGESGSGKTMTALAVVGLLPRPVRIKSGHVIFDGKDLASVDPETLRAVRGAEISMIFQDPMSSLNPLLRIGEQIAESMRVHGVAASEARKRTLDALARVGIANPGAAARVYPHEFSGGMRQRVMIACALVMSPKLLIADEATSALDVTIQQQIITLVKELQEHSDLAVVWITHDMGVVARLVDRVMVMYGGHLVERGRVHAIFNGPEHPYTAALLRSIPLLTDRRRDPLVQIPGRPPDPGEVERGCPFVARCPQSIERCVGEMPPMTERAGGGAAACWVPPEKWKT